MLAITEVVERYRGLMRDRGLSVELMSNRPPPFLCRQLIIDENFDAVNQDPFTGNSHPEREIYTYNNNCIDILWGKDIGSFLDILPLDGHFGFSAIPSFFTRPRTFD